VTAPHPLDNPVRSSLAGPHARFAERRGNVLRYPVDVSPFLALPDQPDAADWADAAALAGPGALVALAGVRASAPDGWQVTLIGAGVQLVDYVVEAAADGEAVRLGPGDVPEMLELAGRTKPGPFLPRTVELGSYLGIRRGGTLVAMAGSGCTRPAGPRSARCARTTRGAASGSPHAWCVPWWRASGPAVRRRSCTPWPTTRRSASMGPWGSGCAAAQCSPPPAHPRSSRRDGVSTPAMVLDKKDHFYRQ
jgi:hypothetical protein